MTYFELVDELYEAFARSLPAPLAETARLLSAKIGLVPREGLPWSDVFRHEIILAAPAIFAEATPDVPSRIVRDATSAHLFGVVHAFASDRLLDGEAAPTEDLLSFVGALRKARDAATVRVRAAGKSANVDEPAGTLTESESALTRWRDAEAERAIRVERTLLRHASPVSFETYECISRAKQAAAAPASIELARAAGWSVVEIGRVADLFESLALGLQMYDDVADWEKDLNAAGAWAAALIGAANCPLAEARLNVRESMVLPRMLDRGREHFEHAGKLARSMNAHEIAAWAEERRDALSHAFADERKSPGYASRAQALNGWALEVLH